MPLINAYILYVSLNNAIVRRFIYKGRVSVLGCLICEKLEELRVKLPNQCVLVFAVEPPGETPFCEIWTQRASASLPFNPLSSLGNDDVPCSTFNSPLNSSCLLTQAESQCFLHLPFA